MPSKTVKVMRVRPRAAFRDQKDDAALRGMGQIIEVSEKVASNARLMKSEGYVRVTETQEPTPAVPSYVKGGLTGDVPEVKEPVAPETKEPANDVDPTVNEKALASPAARKLANEHFIDLAHVKGTGKSGYITKGDVERLVK